MKIKLTTSSPSRQVTSKTSGKPFHISNAELPDEAGEWKTCRWSIISDRPIPVGVLECVVQSYDAMRGEGRARPL